MFHDNSAHCKLPQIISIALYYHSVGIDYRAEDKMIAIPAGVSTVYYPVTILDDDVFELVEEFTATLHNVTGNRVMLSRNVTSIQITDDNCKFFICYYYD